jgi:hypothetical protein
MMSSFIILALTGLPQKFSGLGLSQWWVQALGGLEVVRAIHRTAGFVMLSDCLYHIGYLAYRMGVQRQMGPLRMLPQPSDVPSTILYFLGVTPASSSIDSAAVRLLGDLLGHPDDGWLGANPAVRSAGGACAAGRDRAAGAHDPQRRGDAGRELDRHRAHVQRSSGAASRPARHSPQTPAHQCAEDHRWSGAHDRREQADARSGLVALRGVDASVRFAPAAVCTRRASVPARNKREGRRRHGIKARGGAQRERATS